MTPKKLKATLAKQCNDIERHLAANNNRTTPSAIFVHIDMMFNEHRKNPGVISDYEFAQCVSDGLTTFAAYLGASKDMQMFRDGSISHHISKFDNTLIQIHAMNEDVSNQIMIAWPKAYMGIDKGWTTPAKLCL